MRWKHVDLARNKVAAAPFGGPLVVIRDDSKIVQLHSESALRKLHIFSSSGQLLTDTIWRNPGGRLIGMSWTDDHTLVCIVQDGTVYRYDVHAHLIELNLSLGKECFESNIADCAFWGNVSFLSLKRMSFSVSRILKTLPQYTVSGNVEVLPLELAGLRVICIAKEVESGDGDAIGLRLKEIADVAEECVGPDVTVSFGDMKAFVNDDGETVRHVDGELAKLMQLHYDKFWLLGSAASYESCFIHDLLKVKIIKNLVSSQKKN